MQTDFSPLWEVNQILKFTDTYKQLKDSPVPLREAGCMSVQFPACMRPPVEGDLFVGRRYDPAVFFSPQPGYMSLGWC